MNKFPYIIKTFRPATKIFKVKDDLCPEITGNMLIEETNCCHNLRYRKDFIELFL